MRRIGPWLTLFVLMIVLVCDLHAATALRERVCLNGVWKFSPGSMDQETLAPKAKFHDIPVPAFWDRLHEFGIKAPWPRMLARGWYRRSFTVSPAWKGRRIALTFDGVRYVCEVFVNGKSVGKSIDGFLPFTVDISNVVKFGKPNDLLVKVSNWRALLYPDAKDKASALETSLVRNTRALSAPAGVPPHMGNRAGIWQDVWLETGPKRRVERVKIDTSVANHSLAVRTWTAGKMDGLTLKHDVLDDGKAVLSADGTPNAKQAISVNWPDPKLWWPHSPHLYTLRTRLLDKDDRVVDEIKTRFGFREIRIDGRNFLLNGERLNIRGDNYIQRSDAAGMIALRKKYAKALFEQMKRCNINAVRLHCNPSPSSTLEAADEVGMLVFNESATYGSEAHFRADDPLFQKNNRKHLANWIRRDWNHPSVIAWSLSNEFGLPAGHERALHQWAKKLDPTRIVYSDGNTQEYADIWCGHYTYHWARTPQLPNTAYWFGDPAWVKRTLNKPIESLRQPYYVGEFYNVDMTADTLSPSVFFGPKNAKKSRNEKQALHFWALRFVAEGARYTELAGINPFCLIQHMWSFCTPTGVKLTWSDPSAPGVKPTRPGAMMVNPGYVGGPKYSWTKKNKDVQFAYSPMYAYTKQYAHTFWSGDTVKRRITCFNDDMRKLPKVVRWSVTAGGKSVAKGQHTVKSKIGYRDEFDISFTLPKVAQRTEGQLRLAVDVDGKKVFENPIHFVVFPHLDKLENNSDKTGLWRVSEAGRKRLKALGISGRVVKGAEDLKNLRVVILGQDSAGKGDEGTFYEDLARFVKTGGGVVSLHQDNMYWMPGRLSMDDESWSTIAFAAGKEHAATAGLKENDLRFWGDDHVVVRDNLRLDRLPDSARAVIVAGSPMGLVHTPLVEYRYGKGAYFLCQMPVLEKSASEGAAGTLLRNLVDVARKCKRQVPAKAQPFTYRRLWEAKLSNRDVLPPESPGQYKASHVSQLYGSTGVVLGWIPKGGFVEWKVKGIPKGIEKVAIQLIVRTGGRHYTVSVNGKAVPMQDTCEYERETFDSFRGWKIFTGQFSSTQPITIKNGDLLRITANQDWAAVVQVKLRGEFPQGR